MFGRLYQWILRLLSRSNGSDILEPSSPSSGSQRALLDNDEFTPTFKQKIIEQLRRDEGVRHAPYDDPLGFLTIGIGHLIDARKGGFLPDYAKPELERNGRLSDFTVNRLLMDDLEFTNKELLRRAPWMRSLDEARYGCMINMAFQMGVTGLLGFKNTLVMVQNGDYEGAAKGMLNSLWATQTPNRARRVSQQMQTGRWV